ncbi:E3 ubiquitin-protein ligase, partial [Trifolium medium]|nr:E3 ubiquitin-protein ligase [Trifolium medium]
MVFFTLFSIIPIIALDYALRIREGSLRIREGASEDDIRSLPMYRFNQSNVMVMVDDNKKQFVKAGTSELSLHPDDS